MARVVVGNCPQCGATLKIREHAARPTVRYTCTCGWSSSISIDNALVARGEALRSERLKVKHRRMAERQSRMWRLVVGVLGITSALALLLAISIPGPSKPAASMQGLKLLLYVLGIGCALGLVLSIGALRDVERSVAQRRKKRKRK